MTEYSWSDVRDEATAVFGNGPTDDQERDILTRFMKDPAYVVRVLAEVGAAVKAGRIQAGWPFAHTHVVRDEPADKVATDEEKRRRVLFNALSWVRNVGGQYDRESEVAEELFGELGGRFNRWPDLEPEVLAEWRARYAPAPE